MGFHISAWMDRCQSSVKLWFCHQTSRSQIAKWKNPQILLLRYYFRVEKIDISGFFWMFLNYYHWSILKRIFRILDPEKTCVFLAYILSVLDFMKVIIYVMWPTNLLSGRFNTFTSDNVIHKSAPVDRCFEHQLTKPPFSYDCYSTPGALLNIDWFPFNTELHWTVHGIVCTTVKDY